MPSFELVSPSKCCGFVAVAVEDVAVVEVVAAVLSSFAVVVSAVASFESFPVALVVSSPF